MNNSSTYLLAFLREAFGVREGALQTPLSAEEWKELVDLSFAQGVDAISVDGYSAVAGDKRARIAVPSGLDGMEPSGLEGIEPSGLDVLEGIESSGLEVIESEEMEDLRYEWFGSVFQAEEEYKRYAPKAKGLCQFYVDNGFRPVLLKGLGLGLDYPVPAHRPVGDIDIFLVDGNSLEGDRLAVEKLGAKVKKSRIGHHSHFWYKGASVENHYELSNSYFGGRRTRRLEARLKELISKDLRRPYDDCPFFLPSANFNAVFLMWHLGTHFCSDRIILRQLCDWYCFLRAHHAEIDWPLVTGIWQEAGMTAFAQAICALMRKHFLMPAEWMGVGEVAGAGGAGGGGVGCVAGGAVGVDGVAAGDRVMDDVLYGAGRGGNGVAHLLHYLRFSWKYKLVTGRSGLRPLLASAWMHLFRSGDMKESCTVVGRL